MALVDEWRRLASEFPERWTEARVLLTVGDAADAPRAATLLAPARPGRHRNEIRFTCARRGTGAGPEAVRRLLALLDAERIEARLELLDVEEAAPVPARPKTALADAWDAALATLPEDWSDLYVEVEIFSSDHLERGALLLSPTNPARYGGTTALRFRCARLFGYGASPEMVRRCLERLDVSDIRGTIRILRALSDSRPVATQGPVWYVEGKAV